MGREKELRRIAEGIRDGARAGRRYLEAVLGDLEVGRLGLLDVVNQCEAVREALEDWPDHPETDPRSIGVAVLELLSEAHVQLLLPEDIPAVQAFLATEAGAEEEAWAEFNAYWEGIDWERRNQSSH